MGNLLESHLYFIVCDVTAVGCHSYLWCFASRSMLVVVIFSNFFVWFMITTYTPCIHYYNCHTRIIHILFKWKIFNFQCTNLIFRLSFACHFFLNLPIARRCNLTVDIWYYMEGLMPGLTAKTDNDGIEQWPEWRQYVFLA